MIRYRRNLGGPPIDKNKSSSTTQIIDPENPDLATRPPAPLPEPVNVPSDEDYVDPDELHPTRKLSVISPQWPSPYDEIRITTKPPALPPARKPSTTSTQIIPRSVSCPTSYPERRREIESRGYPQSPVSITRRTSGTALNSSSPNAGTGILSTDSEVPDVPKKKRASFAIPSPPIPEEKSSFKNKPLTPTFDEKVLPHETFPLAAYEKGGHQYDNLPSSRPGCKSSSDTHLMPPIAEVKEQSNSDRPGLSQHETCDSVALDPHGYITIIASKGERLSEDQPLSSASDANVLPDMPSSSAVFRSNVPKARGDPDISLIPRTAEATEQCVSSRPDLSQRESCDSIALDPQGYVNCITQNASLEAV